MDLIATTAGLAKKAAALYRAIEGAPTEIRQVSNRLYFIQSILDNILALWPPSESSSHDVLPSHLRAALTLALEQNSEAMNAVQRTFIHRRSKVKASGRFRWALLERSETKKALGELHQADTSLALALQILQMWVLRSGESRMILTIILSDAWVSSHILR